MAASRRPLYQGADPGARRPLNGHAGLWYDKFCDRWMPEWSMASDGGGSPKLDWIKTVTGNVGNDSQIDEHVVRLVQVAVRRGGSYRVFAATSRFVTGLGRSHPVENGFAWHPTLGAPYLPGSSIKGMVRAWVRSEGDGSDRASLNRLFGDRVTSGSIAFLDAIPIEPVTLDADVMTPHYANWTPKDPPGDWRSPTPIPFLTAAAGTKLLLGAIPCRDAGTEDVATFMEWIASALEWQGAGAKTAVGYGRFERDSDAEATLHAKLGEAARAAEERDRMTREQERLASLSPIEREIEELTGSRPNQHELPSAFVHGLASAGHWAGQDRVEVARWLKSEMRRDKTWRPTKKKPPKPHKRTRQVIQWLGDD